MSGYILIVDDEIDIREAVTDILGDEGYQTAEAENADDAFAIIDGKIPDLVVLDIWLEDSRLDGMEILEALSAKHPELPVIMMSGHGNIETAVSALHKGAYDFIEKPFKADKLLVLVKRALETQALRKENIALKQEVRKTSHRQIDGTSSAVQQLLQVIDRVAPTNSRVLITGEPGSGKEVIAQMIHDKSDVSEGPYIVVNCASLAPERLDELLFGVEGGKTGMLEQAHGGTILLDEIGDMPLETQSKIVRVLQDQHFTRIGGEDEVEVELRILASSNQNLQQKMDAGDFRQDLFYRLNVVPLHMPPLRQRREDIVELVQKVLTKQCRETGREIPTVTPEAMALLQSYDWPGNTRQLKNVIEWVLIMFGDQALSETGVSIDMLPPEITGQEVKMAQGGDHAALLMMTKPLREAREIFEKEYLLSQLERFDGNISKTAQFVGMERSALHRKLKNLGVQSETKEAKAIND